MALTVVSCDKGDDTPAPEKQQGSFIIVATSGEASYLLQTGDLTKGEMTIENSGLETDNGTEWEFNSSKYLYRLQYNQGNPGIVSSYILNASEELEERGIANEIRSRFTTHGSYGKYIVMAAAVATDTKDGSNNPAQGVTFSYIHAEAHMMETKTIVTENFLGNGEYVTFSGVADINGKIFTAVCPVGLSAYGAAKTGASSYSGTHYTDSVWIAVFDDISFTNPRIIRDDRLSYATTRFRSQYYTNLAVDDRQNLYVFSSAYENDKTTKPSGVLRINAGTETFDPNFFVDIEAASGGHHVCKPYYITGDYFLLQMYTNPNVIESNASAPIAYRLAIFNAASKSFTWVTGLPDVSAIGSLGKKAAVSNGVIYLPVVTTDGKQPAIYGINPATATASRGVVVTCTGIAATGILRN